MPDEPPPCDEEPATAPTASELSRDTNLVSPPAVGSNCKDALGSRKKIKKKEIRAKPDASGEPPLELRVYQVDPAKIIPSRWAIRRGEHFQSDEFKKLRNDIAQQRGNITPVALKLIEGSHPDDPAARFEMIFGHSRIQACRELNLLVKAIVTSNLTEQDIVYRMHGENKRRTDTSPYEDGLFYQKLLDSNVFSSMRRLANGLGVDVSQISKAIKLAKLDPCVFSAFESPTDLQFEWAKPLTDAWEARPEEIAKTVKKIVANRRAGKALSKNQVYQALLGRDGDNCTQPERQRKTQKTAETSYQNEAEGAAGVESFNGTRPHPSHASASESTPTEESGPDSVSNARALTPASTITESLRAEALKAVDSPSPEDWLPLVASTARDLGFITTLDPHHIVICLNLKDHSTEIRDRLAQELAKWLERASFMRKADADDRMA